MESLQETVKACTNSTWSAHSDQLHEQGTITDPFPLKGSIQLAESNVHPRIPLSDMNVNNEQINSTKETGPTQYVSTARFKSSGMFLMSVKRG